MAAVELPSGGGGQWNPNASKYKCCCGCCHVRTGAMILAVIEVILIILWIGSTVAKYYTPATKDNVDFGINIGLASWGSLVTILLIVGMCTERGVFIVPHLIYQVVSILGVLILAILTIVSLAQGKGLVQDVVSKGMEEAKKMDTSVTDAPKIVRENIVGITGGLMLAGYFLNIVIQIWFFTVFYKCYKYFNHAEKYDARDSRVVYGGPASRGQGSVHPAPNGEGELPGYTPQEAYTPGYKYGYNN